MKKLYILRHAKSAYPENTDDHERPLNKRGEKACVAIGRYLRDNSLIPEKVLCSDAIRTTMTAKNVFTESGADVPIDFLSSLYLASPGEILKEISKVDDNIELLIIVCHNPGAQQTSKILIGGGDEESVARLNQKYPTAGLACFSLDINSWKDIEPGRGYLDKFVIPKML